MVEFTGRLSNRFSTSLILAVAAWSDEVLFHTLIESSWYRMETTTPHISLPV